MPRTIGQVMTAAPYSVQKHHLLPIADRLMTEKDIRHLPVLEGQRLVGILSLTDLRKGLELPGASQLDVGAVMKSRPYAVGSSTALAEVVLEMANRKLGSVVVVDNERVRGIFTSVDALRLLAELVDR